MCGSRPCPPRSALLSRSAALRLAWNGKVRACVGARMHERKNTRGHRRSVLCVCVCYQNRLICSFSRVERGPGRVGRTQEVGGLAVTGCVGVRGREKGGELRRERGREEREEERERLPASVQGWDSRPPLSRAHRPSNLSLLGFPHFWQGAQSHAGGGWAKKARLTEKERTSQNEVFLNLNL